MSVRSGRYTFPWITYDPPSDVLYAKLSGAPQVSRERTEEGDVWTFDQMGRPTGVIVNEPRERLQGVEAAMRGAV